MPSDRLSAKERAALLALLGHAREISNLELEELVGFRLDGKERRRLNEQGLVDSRKDGRPYVHELTDAGWRWCADELAAGPGPRAGSMERALYAVLTGVRRYLNETGLSLADIFGLRTVGEPINDAEVESSIVAGYRALASEPGKFVKLSGLRRKLAHVPHAEVDAALGEMYRAQRINLVPQSNQRALTHEDRESALRIGGENKHLISIER